MVDIAKKSVERLTETGGVQEDMTKNFCINVLRAMELDDKEDEEDMDEDKQNKDEEQEQTTLPEEWVYARNQGGEKRNQLEGEQTAQDKNPEEKTDTLMREEQSKGKEERNNQKTRWGSVQAERRSSRLQQDDRTTVEKAQQLKRKVNMEDNPGKTIISSKNLTSNYLLSVAKSVDIEINTNNSSFINNILELDEGRKQNFLENCNIQECGANKRGKNREGGPGRGPWDPA